MYYEDFKDLKISGMGMGGATYPSYMDKKQGKLITEASERLIDYAYQNGINYYDTGWFYNEGHNEEVVGKALSKYPRNTYYINAKYDGNDRAEVFEKQLDHCQVDYFDFYQVHRFYHIPKDDFFKNSINFLLKQKNLNRIKHIGISSHANSEQLEHYLSEYHSEIEFIQIPLNYYDWSLDNSDLKRQYDIIMKYGIPIWVMKCLKIGNVEHPLPYSEAKKELLSQLGWISDAQIGYWWAQTLPGVKVILSGSANLNQLKENLTTFNTRHALTTEQFNLVLKAVKQFRYKIDCINCGYCNTVCSAGLDIPSILKDYNNGIDINAADKCIFCEKCLKMCPQGIRIPEIIHKSTIK